MEHSIRFYPIYKQHVFDNIEHLKQRLDNHRPLIALFFFAINMLCFSLLRSLYDYLTRKPLTAEQYQKTTACSISIDVDDLAQKLTSPQSSSSKKLLQTLTSREADARQKCNAVDAFFKAPENQGTRTQHIIFKTCEPYFIGENKYML